MRYLLLLVVFLSGFIAKTAVEEVADIRAVIKYERCVKTTMDQPGYDKEETLSAWQQCNHLLKYSLIEEALLYRPSFWRKFSTTIP